MAIVINTPSWNKTGMNEITLHQSIYSTSFSTYEIQDEHLTSEPLGNPHILVMGAQ